MPDPSDESLARSAAPETRRWTLIRDLIVFVAKASLEAIRDLVLIPLSIVAGLVGLFTDRDEPDALFRRILSAGRRFDAWLNLFGALGPDPRRDPGADGPRVDDLFERLEAIVVEQHQRGGVTAGAKGAIDRALDRVQSARTGSADGREGRGGPR